MCRQAAIRVRPISASSTQWSGRDATEERSESGMGVEFAENVLHMTQHAMSMVGGSSFRKGSIFERLYRDAAASMFQPLNADQSRTYIGEALLAPDV